MLSPAVYRLSDNMQVEKIVDLWNAAARQNFCREWVGRVRGGLAGWWLGTCGWERDLGLGASSLLDVPCYSVLGGDW